MESELMATNMSLQEMQKLADVYLKESDQNSLPINISRLINENDFKILKLNLEMDGTSGLIMVDDDKPVFDFNINRLIVVDDSLSYERKRFISAHEFAHFALHKESGTMIRHRDVRNGNDDNLSPQEKEADNFALCLLTPESLVHAEVEKLKIDVPNPSPEFIVKYIAKKSEITDKKSRKRLEDLEII